MRAGLIIIAAFMATVLFMLFKYESNKRGGNRVTGRGGDFQD
jgi:hypothetical protein